MIFAATFRKRTIPCDCALIKLHTLWWIAWMKRHFEINTFECTATRTDFAWWWIEGLKRPSLQIALWKFTTISSSCDKLEYLKSLSLFLFICSHNWSFNDWSVLRQWYFLKLAWCKKFPLISVFSSNDWIPALEEYCKLHFQTSACNTRRLVLNCGLMLFWVVSKKHYLSPRQMVSQAIINRK